MKLTFARKATLAFATLSLLCLATGDIGIAANKIILKDLSRGAANVLPAIDYSLQLDRDMHQALPRTAHAWKRQPCRTADLRPRP